jgi:hypothetical protein
MDALRPDARFVKQRAFVPALRQPKKLRFGGFASQPVENPLGFDQPIVYKRC